VPATRGDFFDLYEAYHGTYAGWEEAYAGYSSIPYDDTGMSRAGEIERMEDWLVITDTTGAPMTKQEWASLREEYFALYGGTEDEEFPWENWRDMYEALAG
jgi:hypothetical protein